MRVFSFIFLLISLQLTVATAQNIENRVPNTAVPFLTLNSNARISAFGEVSTVSSDFYGDAGLFQNGALLEKGKGAFGINASYRPWLSRIVNDMYIGDFGMYYSWKNKHSVSYTYRHFDLGNILFTDDTGNPIKFLEPKEIFHKANYTYHTQNGLSLNTSIKYIRSKIPNNTSLSGSENEEHTITTAFAFDLGLSYRKNLKWIEEWNTPINFGATLNNIGSKVDYRFGIENNLPTYLSLGVLAEPRKKIGKSLELNLALAYQVDKSLVPLDPTLDLNAIESISESLRDTNFSTELKDVIHKIGAETRLEYLDQGFIALRLGYHHQHEEIGDTKYLTTGFGLGFKGFSIDYSKLYPTPRNHPFEDTWAISVSYRSNLFKN
ncbi:PorV/PorQ family protein [Sediminitomix flava]|uniref:Type IX secretion system protein PorV domain-containing protein n=1 Tax=Sediminitomix flava TaxID=379075 RepID=A0A315ZGX2_SEDFL|nr:PorV/PorQ family protein [Sediminitomix flava]PWJ44761.1 hypothetical protein BC781_1011132 [Sediminitomix flava]